MVNFKKILKKKIGLFPGSFNPIHLGHLTIAQRAYEKLALDEVWFVLTPQNPLKKNSTLLAFKNRWQLLKLALRKKKYFKSSQIERYLFKPNYTSKTIRFLKIRYPFYDFTLILGEDNLTNFDQWKHSKWLLKTIPIAFYKRSSRDSLKKAILQKISLISKEVITISSSEIRMKLQKKKFSQKDVETYLLKPVLEMIKEKKFYF